MRLTAIRVKLVSAVSCPISGEREPKSGMDDTWRAATRSRSSHVTPEKEQCWEFGAQSSRPEPEGPIKADLSFNSTSRSVE